ncbi:MAG TPA: glucose-6-phosphate dehydrogenase [Acidimicrobiales bacterium]|nr:glucose-6-phosphate dehydrogenase [Acidimicrobiales bacterium]
MNPGETVPTSERAPTHAIVLFGATGDLAKRKIIPGLFHLAAAGLLSPDSHIIGSAPRAFALSTEAFRAHARDAVRLFGSHPPEGPEWENFERMLTFAVADPDEPSDLLDELDRIDAAAHGRPARLFHLAVPPDAVLAMIEMLGTAGLNEGAKVICEKPFGTDLASARTLNAALAEHFDESQIFRIDHFLGKESVDNVLALRFSNGFFEPLWNRHHVRYVQIDVPETLSIEGRGPFYEATGAFRDMVVTHLFQVLGFVAMEEPASLEATLLRDEVHKVFHALRPVDPADVVRAQYEGYRDEPKVAADSVTETFVALRVAIDNERWRGVPFYLRTGKRLAASRQVITLGLRRPPTDILPVDHEIVQPRGNRLTIDFADPGSICAHFLTKRPGPSMILDRAQMTFRYEDSFQMANHLAAYEHLILQAMLNNQLLFTRADGIERLWRVAEPLLEMPPPIETYEPGSWGPESIERIVTPDAWCLPE